jgi:phosphoglycerate-specific signal transduction histidine kinase
MASWYRLCSAFMLTGLLDVIVGLVALNCWKDGLSQNLVRGPQAGAAIYICG